MSAASAILDLANGLEQDKSLVTALFALELARDAGADAPTQRAAFFGALLRHLGCTAYAAGEARIASDDIALRRNLIHGDSRRTTDVVRSVGRANGSWLSSVLGVSRLALSARQMRAEWTFEACGAARLLAEGLGFGPDVVQVVDEAFERWDGTGTPHGRGGGDLSPAGRAANVAHVAVVFWLDGGVALATEVLHARSGAALDPAFVARAVGLLPSLELGDPWFEERSASAAAALDPGPAVSADSVAVAFGEFGDLQSPFTRGHSGRVAAVADAAAATLGTDAADRQTLRWAAHLHDLGQVAIPTALWLVPRPWRAVERARTLSHPQVTERVLAGAPAFAAAARVAGQHHERPDGAGYPRGLGGASVPRLARILAAADVVVALAEPRPHRPAFEGSRLGAEVEAVVRAGGLDGDCAEAALAAVGQRRREPLSGPVAELTPREVQVLRLVALGRTNKEVASTLGISDRTVQHHTIRIYEKLGIDTRAAAGLIAARNGLV